MCIKSNQTFLSQICHEIGNPLTLIYGTIQLMESETPHIVEMERWNQLREDVKNLTLLFHELSTLSQADSLHIAPTDLYELLYDLMDSFYPIASEKNIQLAFDDTNIFINAIDYPCDVVKIRQALTNLLKNAIEASNAYSTVTIALTPCNNPPFPNDGEKTYLSLTIENDGPTIPKEEMDRIFEPFHTTKPNGTGLGLPITAKMIQAHGGRIDANSTKDHTTFTVYLPVP